MNIERLIESIDALTDDAEGSIDEKLDAVVDAIVGSGCASQDEAEAALAYFDRLADRELAGDVSHTEAMHEVIDFATKQVTSRTAVRS